MTIIGPHKVTHASIVSITVDMMLAGDRVDVFYSDPPWGDGNLRYWQTMNQKITGADVPQVTHEELWKRLTQLIYRYVAGYVFIETGLRWREFAINRLKPLLGIVQEYPIWYMSGGKRIQNLLLAGAMTGNRLPDLSECVTMTGAAVSRYCVKLVGVRGGIVFDPCCGMGYSARAAVGAGMRFRGNELNAKRLQKTIQFLTAACGQGVTA
jgi:hypothetical protein